MGQLRKLAKAIINRLVDKEQYLVVSWIFLRLSIHELFFLSNDKIDGVVSQVKQESETGSNDDRLLCVHANYNPTDVPHPTHSTAATATATAAAAPTEAPPSPAPQAEASMDVGTPTNQSVFWLFVVSVSCFFSSFSF